MALPIQQQAKYWGITIAVTAIVLWYLGDVLLPFVLGAAIAYFLDPVADRLEALGLSRIAATAVITIGAVIMFIVAAVIIIPTLVQQTTNLFNVAPVMFTKLQGVLAENVPSIMDENSAIRGALSSVGDTIKEKARACWVRRCNLRPRFLISLCCLSLFPSLRCICCWIGIR